MRTFLATALGHTCGMLEPERRRVCGMDVHEPDWFVPLDEVIYLHNIFDPSRLRECFQKTWPFIAESKSKLTILNGIRSAMEDMDAEICQLALRRHVVVTDEVRFNASELARRSIIPTHLLTVVEEKENRVRVVVQRLNGI